jgi:hypothetical protein
LLLYLYITLASEAKAAMEDFVKWIKMQHVMRTNGDTNIENIVLAAHSRIHQDHVYLIKTLLNHEVEPPQVRFADTRRVVRSEQVWVGRSICIDEFQLAAKKIVEWPDVCKVQKKTLLY